MKKNLTNQQIDKKVGKTGTAICEFLLGQANAIGDDSMDNKKCVFTLVTLINVAGSVLFNIAEDGQMVNLINEFHKDLLVWNEQREKAKNEKH